MTSRRSGMTAALACVFVGLGGSAQASRPGPSRITYEPASTISAGHLRTMKHFSWDVHNVPARRTNISRARALAIVDNPRFRVTEAALTRVTTLATGEQFFDRATGEWAIHPAVDHRIMWTIVAVGTFESATDPTSLGGPVIPGPDPRSVTKVDPRTGDVVLPPRVRHPAPLREWTIRWVTLVDPQTGKVSTAMSL